MLSRLTRADKPRDSRNRHESKQFEFCRPDLTTDGNQHASHQRPFQADLASDRVLDPRDRPRNVITSRNPTHGISDSGQQSAKASFNHRSQETTVTFLLSSLLYPYNQWATHLRCNYIRYYLIPAKSRNKRISAPLITFYNAKISAGFMESHCIWLSLIRNPFTDIGIIIVTVYYSICFSLQTPV